MRQAYEEWPLFSTFIDNIEMSIAKTDERIARMYLALGDREDLNEKVLNEMELTRKWVLAIVGDKWPLQHRHVLGQAIRIRSPYVDALSVTQVLAPQVAAQEGGQGRALAKPTGRIHLPHPVHRLRRRRGPAEHGLIPGRPIDKSERGGSVPINGAGLPARVIRP